MSTKKRAKDVYIAEMTALGPEAALVDEIMQVGIGETMTRAMARVPTMTDAAGVALVRALLVNSTAAAVRLDIPEDAFMRMARSAYNIARTLTREVDEEDGN